MIMIEDHTIIYNLNFRSSKCLSTKNLNLKFHKINNFIIIDKILNDENPFIFDIY